MRKTAMGNQVPEAAPSAVNSHDTAELNHPHAPQNLLLAIARGRAPCEAWRDLTRETKTTTVADLAQELVELPLHQEEALELLRSVAAMELGCPIVAPLCSAAADLVGALPPPSSKRPGVPPQAPPRLRPAAQARRHQPNPGTRRATHHRSESDDGTSRELVSPPLSISLAHFLDLKKAS